ncbi:hypothetical protein RFI_35078, partial [Reticulomyxa filosa]
KWNDKQLNIAVQCLIDGFQNINGYDNYISRDLLEGIAMKLNETQTDSVFMCLINGLKGNNEKNRKLYAESIGYVSMKLNKKQLNDVFKCLNGQLDRIFSAFIHGIIAAKASEKQLEEVVNTLIFVSKHSNNDKDKDRSLMRLLELISTKLNDKQLYLL